MTALEFSRWFLAAFFVFVGVFYTLRLVGTRRPGKSKVAMGRPFSRHWWLSMTFHVFRTVILVTMAARAVWPGIDPWFVPFGALMAAPVVLTGNALLLASFAFVIYVHKRMGPAWRSGVHARPPERLITTGPFAFTRNPMFLGVQGAQLGFFLSFPSLFTLVCLIVGVSVIHMQVPLEEAQLRAAFGRQYEDYCRQVPRWLPRLRALMPLSARG